MINYYWKSLLTNQGRSEWLNKWKDFGYLPIHATTNLSDARFEGRIKW